MLFYYILVSDLEFIVLDEVSEKAVFLLVKYN